MGYSACGHKESDTVHTHTVELNLATCKALAGWHVSYKGNSEFCVISEHFSLSSCHLSPTSQMNEIKRGFWFPTWQLYGDGSQWQRNWNSASIINEILPNRQLESQSWSTAWSPSVEQVRYNVKFLWGKMVSSVGAVETFYVSLCKHHSLYSA